MYRSFRLLVAGLFLVWQLAGCGAPQSTSPAALLPIRIGWQTTWATQGQITQTLAHTNALAKNNLQATFVGVSYGAPLNEAALANNVDVIFTADQPAAALLARTDKWQIIGRLMFNRVALYVPPESPIKTAGDLKGKTIAMPFGAAAQRVALKFLRDAGLDPKTDIKAVNLDITEQTALIKKGTPASWGDIDAMAGFDPTSAVLETSHLARMLHVGIVTSVIVMSKDYIAAYPQAPMQFLKAYKQAVLYYAQHQQQANDWFRQASQLTIDDAALEISASVEPNVKAQTIRDVDILFTPEQIAGMQEAADFIFDAGLVKQRVTMEAHVDQSYAQRASTELEGANYDPNSITVLQ